MWFEATFMPVSSKQSGRFVSTLRERLVRGEIREPQWIPGSFMKLALQAFTELKMIFKKVQEGCKIRRHNSRRIVSTSQAPVRKAVALKPLAYRRFLKNSCSISAERPASTPALTSIR